MAPDPTSADPGDPFLRRARALAGPGGVLRFDHWMELALYGEGVGYYASDRTPLGPSGDFYTASHVHPLYGATLGQRVREIRSRLLDRGTFHLVELGPGDGTLLAAALPVVFASSAESRDARVVLVERSSSLERRARERVRAVAEPLGVEVTTADSISALGPFSGVVLAHEVLDAQPVRRLRWSGAAWEEMSVRVDGPAPAWVRGPLVAPVPPPTLPSPREEGTIVEVSSAAEDLARELADHLVDGVAILVDYGLDETELLHGHSGGTLATIRDHRVGSDPLEAPGRQDLSTFVNWTRLLFVAQQAGLDVVADRRFAEALEAYGFPERLRAALDQARSSEAEVRLRLLAKNLAFGFERFRVLELAPRARAPELRRAT